MTSEPVEMIMVTIALKCPVKWMIIVLKNKQVQCGSGGCGVTMQEGNEVSFIDNIKCSGVL